MDKLLQRIVIDSEVCNGQPVIRGMRITVKTILEYLAAGESTSNILEAYPILEKGDIQAAILYASKFLDIDVKSIKLAS
ncbi:DUF433 domain-containing protein [Imperialibacter roseus]|uniref:DUF433 domain-containing protein n=1 Tax=Imperialibacter roseus TaxID=1324217 RepID=A0ABZ0IKP9_9BACT|nr:DUF433 domain-containing protein [Imperialibacter roseus]WOK05236.1 DUF433 domain-containing protein [Imperialibacter roseus]